VKLYEFFMNILRPFLLLFCDCYFSVFISVENYLLECIESVIHTYLSRRKHLAPLHYITLVASALFSISITCNIPPPLPCFTPLLPPFRCGDYYGIRLVQQLRGMPDKMKARAEVAVYMHNFDEAEAIYRYPLEFCN
jgi:hypothetical protein